LEWQVILALVLAVTIILFNLYFVEWHEGEYYYSPLFSPLKKLYSLVGSPK
jgi:hypothetical protein